MIELSVNTTKHTEFIDITARVNNAINDAGFVDGILLVFCPHTTAGITINENADPSVSLDLTMKASKIIDRDPDFRHMEGNSDGHLKSSFFGASEQVIIEGGRLVLGTWQGIFFAEFDGPRSRSVYLKFVSC